MKRHIFYFLSMLSILVLLCLSCSDKHDEPHADVLSYFDILEKIEPTYFIDFTSPQSGDYLLGGWFHPENTHRWAEGLESRFFFYGFQRGAQSDTELTINCAPFVFPGSPKQSMEIYLNDRLLKKISLSSSWNQYKVSLPGKLLKEKNMITFKYAYAERPSDHLPDSKDQRKLSIAFKKVSFGTSPSLLLKRDTLLQRVGSLLNYYEKIPRHSQLKFHFKNKKESRVLGCVKIESQDVKSESHFFKQSGNYTVDLDKYTGRITKISFTAEQDDTERSDRSKAIDNSVRWSNIVFYANHSEEKTSRVQDGGALRAVREKLKKCDIIYVVLDAYAAKHSSAYGYHRKTSPMLEELADQGVLFENMFSAASYTLASTASLFTSKYPFEHQVNKEKGKLSPSLMTLAKKLNDHGIATYCISAHPYITQDVSNLTSGFEKMHYKWNFDPDYLAEKILPQIYNLPNSDTRRKFIYFHIVPPHVPYTPPEKFRLFGGHRSKRLVFNIDGTDLGKLCKGNLTVADKNKVLNGGLKIGNGQVQYLLSLYDANILYADEYIRRMVIYLEKEGLLDNVILIVTSDHGEAFMEHGKIQHGSTPYDEVIHVPFVLRFPKAFGVKNVKVTSLISLVDVAPTILDILSFKKETSFKGKSILPAIFENSQTRSAIYSSGLKTTQAVRDIHYKYISNLQGNDELYDLTTDPVERINIIDREPIITKYYSQQLKMIQKNMSHIEKPNTDMKKIDPEKLKQLKELGYVQ